MSMKDLVMMNALALMSGHNFFCERHNPNGVNAYESPKLTGFTKVKGRRRLTKKTKETTKKPKEMSDYRLHPIFGKLTDPEEIAIFDRQQEERAYLEAQQQAEHEAEMRAQEEAYHQAEYEYYWMLFMEENEMITD